MHFQKLENRFPSVGAFRRVKSWKPRVFRMYIPWKNHSTVHWTRNKPSLSSIRNSFCIVKLFILAQIQTLDSISRFLELFPVHLDVYFACATPAFMLISLISMSQSQGWPLNLSFKVVYFTDWTITCHPAIIKHINGLRNLLQLTHRFKAIFKKVYFQVYSTNLFPW
jgi:hypothetical protein